MRNIILLAACLLSFHTASAQKTAGLPNAGFTDLDSMAQEFVRCVKASPEALRAFCYRITYNSAYAENYNGIMQDKVQEMRRHGEIESFEYVGRRDTIYTRAIPGSGAPLYWTETPFLFKTKLESVSCTFGEMSKIAGRWKTDTEPSWRFFHGPAPYEVQRTNAR